MIKEMSRFHERKALSKDPSMVTRDDVGNMKGGGKEKCHSIDESITNIQCINWLPIPCCQRFTLKEIPCIWGLPNQITHEKKKKQHDYTWWPYSGSYRYEIKSQPWKDKKWFDLWKKGIIFHDDWTLD